MSENQDVEKKEAERKAAKSKRFKKNAAFGVISNFLLALAIGSVGTGFAKIIADLDNLTATQIYTVFAGLVFLAFSVMVARMKEPEDD